jgi:protein ImuB
VTVASLFHLPRSSLASRFGEDLLERIDLALGNMPEVLDPYRPQPTLTSRIQLGTATTQINVLIEGIHQALKHFCEKLSQQMVGVRQMFLTFYCPDVVTDQGTQTRTVTLPIDLSQPTRSAKHLGSLLTATLDRLTLPAPTDSLVLWAKETDPLDDWQDELFNTDSSDARELGDLLDRLAIRLGPQTVVRSELLSDHQPERAFRYVSLVGANGTSHSSPLAKGGKRGVERYTKTQTAQRSGPPQPQNEVIPSGPRPLRLSPHPVEVAATAIVPDGPPIAFRFRGTQHTVAESVGPERIETGWWRGPYLKRDYYRVTTKNGQRFWLFRQRDTRRWFLHGWFD